MSVIVSIKDSSAGINLDILPQLFKKFTSKSFPCTGQDYISKILKLMVVRCGLKIIKMKRGLLFI